MAILSVRTLTPANPKAKAAADERANFFREQYRAHSVSLAGKKNVFGQEYTKVEGGNHNSRKALRGALARLAESPTSPEDTDVVIIAGYPFMNDGPEEERRVVKEGEKEKVVKEEVEREGILKLIKMFEKKFRKITVLCDKSPEGPQEGGELDKQIASLRQAAASGNEHVVQVLHSRNEVTAETYSSFLRASTGL